MTTTDVIYLSITGVSLLFSAYIYFRDPQTELDKRQAVDKEEADAESRVLQQKFSDEKEVNQRRFMEMGARIDTSMSMAQNHIHTVDIKMDKLVDQVNSMNISMNRSIATLTTIINERIPKK